MARYDQAGSAGSTGRRWLGGERHRVSPTPERSEQAQRGHRAQRSEAAAAATDFDGKAPVRIGWELPDRWRRPRSRLGCPRHDEVAVPVDPARREMVTMIDDSGTPPGTVRDVLEAAHGEPDHQLRPAAVAVGRRE
jgi:hypothetical protein